MQEWNSWFLVHHTSIEGSNGLGLYAKKRIRAGTILPGGYCGRNITSSQYEKLINLLEKQAREQDYKIQDERARKKEDKVIRNIYEEFGVYLVSTVMDYELREACDIGEEEIESIDWSKVLKGITEYAFGDDQGKMVTVLPMYSFDGRPLYHVEETNNPYILMNEPPNVSCFQNIVSQRVQPSKVNVTTIMASSCPDVVSSLRSSQRSKHQTGNQCDALVRFKTMCDIQAGDELFICYGSMYARSYEINMSSSCGCGMFDQVSTNLDPKVKVSQYKDEFKRHNYVPLSLLSNESKADERVLEYMSKISWQG